MVKNERERTRKKMKRKKLKKIGSRIFKTRSSWRGEYGQAGGSIGGPQSNGPRTGEVGRSRLTGGRKLGLAQTEKPRRAARVETRGSRYAKKTSGGSAARRMKKNNCVWGCSPGDFRARGITHWY